MREKNSFYPTRGGSRSRSRVRNRQTVIFHGSIPHEAVIGYYKDADIFLYPSREESFGLVVAEAMATGLPVISSKAGAISEVVEDGKTGILVEPEEPGRFADAVEFLISHPDTMRQMGMQGIRRVKTKGLRGRRWLRG